MNPFSLVVHLMYPGCVISNDATSYCQSVYFLLSPAGTILGKPITTPAQQYQTMQDSGHHLSRQAKCGCPTQQASEAFKVGAQKMSLHDHGHEVARIHHQEVLDIASMTIIKAMRDFTCFLSAVHPKSS